MSLGIAIVEVSLLRRVSSSYLCYMKKMTPTDLSLIHDYRREDCTSLVGVLFTSEQEFTSTTSRDKTMTSTISRGVLGQATGHSLHRLTI
jgi:hypothetical protein